MSNNIPLTISEAWENYSAFVTEYAAAVQRAVVIPVLEKYNVSFVSGNGTYLLWHEGSDVQLDPDKMGESPAWEQVIGVLNAEVPGYPYDSLANFMPDYKPRKGGRK